jgi:quercetin dioxygenase-like cupin family protein
MGVVHISNAEEATWDRLGDKFPDAQASVELLDSETWVHYPGDAHEPTLYEVQFVPGTEIPPHVHDRDEIIYIVDGEMQLGSRTLGAGSSIFIAANTLYSFRAGQAGLRFLNFRTTGDARTIPKAEFLASRASSTSS